jgi:hypothetical protein
MAIYDIFEAKTATDTPAEEQTPSKKDRLFSSLTARLLFLLLLLADILWGAWALCIFTLSFVFSFLTLFRQNRFRRSLHKQWVTLKRSSVCAISLLVSLFSPALGIMIACTYFLMYDKTGIQEVVPSSLQEQFQEFLK